MVSDLDGHNYTFVVCGNLSSSLCGNSGVGEFAVLKIGGVILYTPCYGSSHAAVAVVGVNHQQMLAV
jgi:hypothetical protein